MPFDHPASERARRRVLGRLAPGPREASGGLKPQGGGVFGGAQLDVPPSYPLTSPPFNGPDLIYIYIYIINIYIYI